jgi:hypothetical protein
VVPYEHTLDDTIPTKFRALSGTKDICDFLDLSSTRSATHHAPALSPATVQRSADSKELIAHVHKEEAPDPNKILLSFRNEQERDAKFKGMVGGFLKGRQEALERYAKQVGDSDPRLKTFYEKKILVSFVRRQSRKYHDLLIRLTFRRRTDLSSPCTRVMQTRLPGNKPRKRCGLRSQRLSHSSNLNSKRPLLTSSVTKFRSQSQSPLTPPLEVGYIELIPLSFSRP